MHWCLGPWSLIPPDLPCNHDRNNDLASFILITSVGSSVPKSLHQNLHHALHRKVWTLVNNAWQDCIASCSLTRFIWCSRNLLLILTLTFSNIWFSSGKEWKGSLEHNNTHSRQRCSTGWSSISIHSSWQVPKFAKKWAWAMYLCWHTCKNNEKNLFSNSSFTSIGLYL